jgi:tetratricopeptide (TPR) repeat protein
MKLGLLEKCGRLFPAIAELTWLIEHGDPDQRHFDLQHRGLVKERLEMYEDAAKDFEQLFLENPDFVGARNHLVTCKYRAKRFEDVIKHTTDTINTLEPDKQSYQLALHLRGKAQLELGRLDLALKDFQRVRHLRGQYFEVSTLEDYPYLDQEVI